jgi:hypothetical protein
VFGRGKIKEKIQQLLRDPPQTLSQPLPIFSTIIIKINTNTTIHHHIIQSPPPLSSHNYQNFTINTKLKPTDSNLSKSTQTSKYKQKPNLKIKQTHKIKLAKEKQKQKKEQEETERERRELFVAAVCLSVPVD